MNLIDLIKSKIFVKENSAMNFLPPKEYIEPFLEAAKFDGDESKLIIKTQGEVVNANEAGDTNTAYPRVNIEVHTEHSVPGFQSVVGIVYALDLQKPEIKVYTGQNASACTNLTIFNAEGVYQQGLLGNFASIFEYASRYVQNKMQEAEEFLAIYNTLLNTFYNEDELNEELGRLLRMSPKTKIGTSPIVQASGRLDNKESIYFIKTGEKCSKMNLYDSITQSFTNSKNILDRPIQTLQLSKLFNVFGN